MTNSYDVDHGLSQDAPGPLEPVEIAQHPGAAPATGNTARDQEMYAAGNRTGEENAKHNAAIRAGMPEGWKLVTKKTCYALMHDGAVIATLAGPESKENAAIIARILAAPGVSTVEAVDTQNLRKLLERATPGPWTWKQVGTFSTPGVALFWPDTSKGGVHYRRLDSNGGITEADAELITNAVKALPALLDAALAAQRKGDA
ncbi:hypothetical protein AADG64_22465 [Achromobacter xylosoxidans]|uniref:hypothetical protein n=1 Tax=Alcaligenes xylosoxydans xylosoxydans TaxID=85698 RepID=UPI003369E4F7